MMVEGGALGAMSMLTKFTEPRPVYFGVLAKKITNGKKDLLELEKAYLDRETSG